MLVVVVVVVGGYWRPPLGEKSHCSVLLKSKGVLDKVPGSQTDRHEDMRALRNAEIITPILLVYQGFG